MSGNFRRWLLLVVFAAAVVGSARFVRERLRIWTHDRLARQYLQQLQASSTSPDQLIHRLASEDPQWLDVLVSAAASQREDVARGAQQAIRELADRWSQMPTGESSPRAALLARLLAVQVPSIAPEQRNWARSLAERLIDWPADTRRINTAQLIADCQAVLLLPTAEPTEIRVTSTPATLPESPSNIPARSNDDPAPVAIPPATIGNSTIAARPLATPQPPSLLPDANSEAAVEPRRFLAPRVQPIRDVP